MQGLLFDPLIFAVVTDFALIRNPCILRMKKPMFEHGLDFEGVY